MNSTRSTQSAPVMRAFITVMCVCVCVCVLAIARVARADAQAASQPGGLSPEQLAGVRQIASVDHLRHIGIAITHYAQSHDDTTPPDLGTLVAAEHVPLPMFVCPNSGGAVPVRWQDMKPQEQAAWVNAHCDYVYVARSKNFNTLMSRQDPIACEKPDVLDGTQVCMLFAPERVQITTPEFARMAVGAAAKTTRVAPAPGKAERLPDLTKDQAWTILARFQMGNLSAALDAFEIDLGRFPTAKEGLDALVHKPATDPDNWRHPFLSSVPLDPWGHPYIYTIPGPKGQDFELRSAGPDGKPGTADDVRPE